MTATAVPTAARFTVAAGALFIVTGCLHGFGLTWATGLAAEGPSELAQVIPALWLGTTAAMLVLGIMLVLVGLKPGPAGRALVGLAALVPLANAALLVIGAGMVAPVYIFGMVGLGALVAASQQPAG